MKTRSKVKEHRLLMKTSAKANAISFIKNDLKKIFDVIGISSNNYAIGGSVAALLYGIEYNRTPHDIDVIVSPETYTYVAKEIHDNVFFNDNAIPSSCDAEMFTKHIAFKTINSPIIDVIAYNEFDIHNTHAFTSDIRVISISDLIESKKKYGRAKDINDLKILEDKFKELYPNELQHDDNATEVNNSLDDFDALAALKAKLESDNN